MCVCDNAYQKKKRKKCFVESNKQICKKKTHRTSVIITLKTIQPYFVPLTFIPKIKNTLNTQRKNQQSVHLKRMKQKMTSIDEK